MKVSCVDSVMKTLVSAFIVCSWYLEVSVGLTYWDLKSLDIPSSHIPYFLSNKNSSIGQGFCEKGDCQVQAEDANDFHCWGYEEECTDRNRFSKPYCIHHHAPWAKTLDDQATLFWEQGDFGYIRKMKKQVLKLCQPKELVCYYRVSRTNTNNYYYHNIAQQNPAESKCKPLPHCNLRVYSICVQVSRFREDVFSEGEVGGHCDFKRHLHKDQGKNKSPLQSWFAELQHFTSLNVQPMQAGICDVVIEKPTIFMKLDSGINLYHHFCDFVNLYVTQHMNGSFNTDVNIVMWDTSTLPYRDFFSVTWKVFTKHPIIRLKDYAGKRVCFRDAVFSFNPRMIRGLYYNMPLVPSCVGSGLFKAFSEHLLHRLGIAQDKHNVSVHFKNISCRQVPFLDQLKITHNSDIFIGMHGAGLTHALFLPDWAVLFELYNTEDPDCYSDLARLRGVNYITWEDKAKLYQEDEGHHPTLGAHAKFTNYAFNVDEFMRLMYKAADAVKDNREKLRHL
ncbi:PREDICTED: EGF domain-specific O-linked N-acetylglucosamine transferase-like [Acropora digitifera]|uniref:EGF domain-specific O-linked N-acetylglucosamine transferase-like n=1 Tax=Acropora digitifera TaxID=70779 RepID=UPI00077AEE4A|nr:PREDICTED: EGF domain-specific O-linked N-acetylglucosamine transferase-like [Acropora digitifera]